MPWDPNIEVSELSEVGEDESDILKECGQIETCRGIWCLYVQ